MEQELQKKTLGVIEYNPTNASIAVLAEKYKDLPDIKTKGGYEAAKVCIREITTLRTGVEKKRKELKADSMAYGKKVDEEAKRITANLKAIEQPVRDLKEEHDNRIETEKQAAIDTENARVEGIREAIDSYKKHIGWSQDYDAKKLSEVINIIKAEDLDEVFFEEFYVDALRERNSVIMTLESNLKTLVDQEAEKLQIESDRKELDELREKQREAQWDIDQKNEAIRVEQAEAQAKIDAEAKIVKEEAAKVEAEKARLKREAAEIEFKKAEEAAAIETKKHEEECAQKNKEIQGERFREMVDFLNPYIESFETRLLLSTDIADGKMPYVDINWSKQSVDTDTGI